jgi:hypothetical protein
MCTMTAVGMKQICGKCDKDFGTDEAKICWECHTYICPHCKQCSCHTTNKFESLFGLPICLN